MPAKKKKGDKAEKKGKKAEGPPIKAPEEIEKPISDSTKEFYFIQIKDLEEKLTKYREKCDKLQVQYGDLSKTHGQAIKDRDDIIALLKEDLKLENQKVQDLEEQIIGEQRYKEEEKDKYEHQLTIARSDFQSMRDNLTAENMALKGRLQSLEDYRLHKEEMEQKLKEREEKIEVQDKDYKDKLHELEKKQLIDQDRLRKDMVSKVTSVANEFRKVSDQQIADTTRRTIRENVAVTQQLNKMSSKTVGLLDENTVLKKREKELRLEIEILETNEKELAKKNKSNQRMINMLLAKATDQGNEIARLQDCERLCVELSHNIQEMEAKCLASLQKTEAAERASSDLEKELAAVKTAHNEVSMEVERLKAVLKQATLVIRSSLEPSTSQSLFVAKRQDLTAALLSLLTLDGTQLPLKRNSKSPIYSPGDLGLVPKPNSQDPFTKYNQKMAKLPPVGDLSPLAGRVSAKTANSLL